MTKKKIITTEEIDTEKTIDIEAEEVTQENPEINELMDYLEGISTSANLVKIYKITEGRKAYCGQTEPGALNEDAILQKWGGGSYYLIAFNNGRFVAGGTRRIELYEPPADAFKNRMQQPDNNGGNNGQLMILQEQINRQHEMMLKLLEAGQKPQMSMGDIVGMMRDMQAMAPKPPDMGAMIAPVLDLFGKTMDMARDSVGGESGKNSWFGLASSAMEKLPLIVGQMAAARGGAPIQNPPETQPDAEGGDMNFIQKRIVAGGISWLKEKAKAGKSIESIADFLLDNIDDRTFGPAAMSIINSPFEDIGKVDPEILQEPLRTWFKSLYDELQRAINENNESSGGPGGGASDIK